MPSRYTITEPHPTVAENHYIHAGRGGAGNHFKAPLTTPPQGVPTPIHPTVSRASTSSASSTNSGRFYSGRGGAGNAHSHIERPVMSFEDEFRREEKRRSQVMGYHVGRGGAGNFASVKKVRKASISSVTSDASSSASSRILKRLSATFKRT